MRFEDAYVSREHRFSLGREVTTGRAYLAVPVSNGIVDYEEYYALDAERYAAFLADPVAALPFAQECRLRQHDDLLLQRPGWNRGTPV